MHPNIQNKTAVITGGSRGIGFRIAEALVEQGAKVLICSRDDASVQGAVAVLTAKRAGKAIGRAVDVRDYKQVESFVAAADKEFGGIDILVNNAGIGIFGSVEDLTPEQWDSVIGTNLNGTFYCTRAVVPSMKRRGGGYIFNISSLAGKNPFAGGAAYNASKFGINGLSEVTMLDLRYHNIRVTYIMPGSVETDFGRATPSKDRVRNSSWKIDATDVAQSVLDLLNTDSRTMISRVEMRPSQPPKK
jgi:3-oxoacyl-[acyl-carrier protein] reductase